MSSDTTAGSRWPKKTRLSAVGFFDDMTATLADIDHTSYRMSVFDHTARHLEVEGLDRSRLPALVLAAFIGGIVTPCGGFETRVLRVIGVTAAPRLFADFVRDFTRTLSVEEFAMNLS